jgi:hypothetical protein
MSAQLRASFLVSDHSANKKAFKNCVHSGLTARENNYEQAIKWRKTTNV